MEFLLQSLWESIQMIVRLDRDLFSALATTLKVSTTSTAIASMIALPLGFLIARNDFPGKRVVQNLLRTALALPTVVVGLLVYAFVARNAPLGEMRLLFTPAAIIIGGIFVLVCDTAARALLGGEIPLGVLTSFFGALGFALLMMRTGVRLRP